MLSLLLLFCFSSVTWLGNASITFSTTCKARTGLWWSMRVPSNSGYSVILRKHYTLKFLWQPTNESELTHSLDTSYNLGNTFQGFFFHLLCRPTQKPQLVPISVSLFDSNLAPIKFSAFHYLTSIGLLCPLHVESWLDWPKRDINQQSILGSPRLFTCSNFQRFVPLLRNLR